MPAIESRQPRLAGTCANGNCPTVYDGGDGTVVIQGYATDRIAVPADERAVELPAAVLLAAADAIRAGA